MKQRPIRILFVHRGGPWLRGSELVLIDLLNCLDRNQYHRVPWCNHPLLGSVFSESDIPIHISPSVIPFHPRGRVGSLSGSWLQFQTALKLIKTHRVDIVHCNNLEAMQWCVPAARTAGVPLLCHLHMIYGTWERFVHRLYGADYIVGCSRAVIRGVTSDGFPSERVKVIHNGFSLPEFDLNASHSFRREIGLSSEDILLATIGAIEFEKGTDLAIEALRSLHERGLQVHLLLFGEGKLEESLRERVSTAGLQSHVHFLGTRPRREVIEILASTVDVTMVPSRYEAFPLVALESQAVGVPVVGSDVGGIAEAVQHGMTGIIVPKGDPGRLADAVDMLLSVPEKSQAMSLAGKKRVREQFSLEEMVNQLDCVYRSLVRGSLSSRKVKKRFLISTRALIRAAGRALGRKLSQRTPAPKT